MEAISLNQLRYYINSIIGCLFLSTSWVAIYGLGIVLGIATLTGIFWGMPKIVGIFFFFFFVG